MTLEEARNYITLATKEGYLSEKEGKRLESLPEKEMIKDVEAMAARGDDYANQPEGLIDALSNEGRD